VRDTARDDLVADMQIDDYEHQRSALDRLTISWEIAVDVAGRI
jgi:hypothetical protein